MEVSQFHITKVSCQSFREPKEKRILAFLEEEGVGIVEAKESLAWCLPKLSGLGLSNSQSFRFRKLTKDKKFLGSTDKMALKR